MPHSDPVLRAKYSREYKRANRWRYRMRQANYDRTKHANVRAASYGAPGVLTIEEVEAVMAAGRCHYCGKTGDMWMGIDHVIPLHEGGLNRPENLVCACHSCNASKFRSDRPRRWARDFDSCQDCGSSTIKHICHGRCATCHYKYDAKCRRLAKLEHRSVAA